MSTETGILDYLNNVSTEKLAIDTGKSSTSTRNKVFISYSRIDEDLVKKIISSLKAFGKKWQY